MPIAKTYLPKQWTDWTTLAAWHLVMLVSMDAFV